jgi:hypothetical protein
MRFWSIRLTTAAVILMAAGRLLTAQTDLDAFMKQVLERRDDNWKKLQQYILDEREVFDVRGPGGFPLWGEQSDFTWFVRDGFFIRSPLRINGVTIGEEDRRRYEANYLRRQRRREARENARESSGAREPGAAGPPAEPLDVQSRSDFEGFIQQTRQPEFVSSAYFLRFKFDQGRYALVGREKLEDRDVLRIEYYPTNLFNDEQARRQRRQDRGQNREVRVGANDPTVDDTVNRLMNKGSRVTLWIEPDSRQIIKYTFDNIDMDFLPAQWMTSVTGVNATMTMGQMFPDVWLPRSTEFHVALMFALGEVTFRGGVNYHDYRRADVTTAIRVPGAPQP